MEDKQIYYIFGIILFVILSFLEFFSKNKRVKGNIRKKSYISNFSLLVFNNVILFVISTSALYLFFTNYSFGLLKLLKINEIYIFIISFFLYDFLIWFWHYLNHRFKFLWAFHKCHHSDIDLNTTTGFRFHIVELLYSIIYKIITILIFGFPIEFIIFFEFVILYFSLFHHSNIKLPFEKYLNKIFVMPIHHSTHHSIIEKEHHSNFGVVFSFWDRIFNTHNKKIPTKFGLKNIKQQNLFQIINFGFKKK